MCVLVKRSLCASLYAHTPSLPTHSIAQPVLKSCSLARLLSLALFCLSSFRLRTQTIDCKSVCTRQHRPAHAPRRLKPGLPTYTHIPTHTHAHEYGQYPGIPRSCQCRRREHCFPLFAYPTNEAGFIHVCSMCMRMYQSIYLLYMHVLQSIHLLYM